MPVGSSMPDAHVHISIIVLYPRRHRLYACGVRLVNIHSRGHGNFNRVSDDDRNVVLLCGTLWYYYSTIIQPVYSMLFETVQ